MKDGTFIYLDSRTKRPTRIRTRSCPNPAVARQMLEDMLSLPVRWEEHRA